LAFGNGNPRPAPGQVPDDAVHAEGTFGISELSFQENSLAQRIAALGDDGRQRVERFSHKSGPASHTSKCIATCLSKALRAQSRDNLSESVHRELKRAHFRRVRG